MGLILLLAGLATVSAVLLNIVSRRASLESFAGDGIRSARSCAPAFAENRSVVYGEDEIESVAVIQSSLVFVSPSSVLLSVEPHILRSGVLIGTERDEAWWSGAGSRHNQLNWLNSESACRSHGASRCLPCVLNDVSDSHRLAHLKQTDQIDSLHKHVRALSFVNLLPGQPKLATSKSSQYEGQDDKGKGNGLTFPMALNAAPKPIQIAFGGAGMFLALALVVLCTGVLLSSEFGIGWKLTAASLAVVGVALFIHSFVFLGDALS